MNIFRKMHYKSKLILCYLALVALPLAFSILLLYNSIIRPVQENAVSAIENRIDQEIYAVTSQIDKLENISYLLSTNTTINRFFQPGYNNSDPELIKAMNNEISPLLSWIEASSNDVYQYHFFTNNPSVPETRFFHRYDIYQDEAWLQDMTAGSSDSVHYWEPAHPNRSYKYTENNSAQLVYSLFRPLLSETGYLEICVLPSAFFNSFDASPVLDSGFIAAFCPDGTPVSDNIPAGLSVPLSQFLSDTLQGQKVPVIPYYADIDGTRYFICHRPISTLDTWLVCIVPESDIMKPLKQAEHYFLAAILAATAGIILLSWLLSTLLIQRITKMTGSVRRIQQGDFQIHLPVNGNDEIDELASAINYMAFRINELINKVYKAEVLQKETELAALQAQINPHFLFNILDTFKMIAIIHDLDDFSDSIASLGSLMRYNISSPGRSCPLRQEIQVLQDYVRIQNLLLNNRVKLSLSVPARLSGLQIPSFVLQPIAENAFVHGFENKLDELLLKVTVLSLDDCIKISIEDNGSGINEIRQKELYESMENSIHSARVIPGSHNSIGLVNVYLRLYLHYNGAASMSFEKSSLGGACINLTLPLPDAISEIQQQEKN